MKRIAFVVGVAVLVFGVGILAKTQAGSVEKELIKLENEANDAWVKHDAQAYGRLLADDYIGTDWDGTTATKAQELENCKSVKNTYTFLKADDFKVRIYGDAAVVTCRNTEKLQVEGKEITEQRRLTDTWVKLAGRWQCVALHSSKIAQK
jgi:hypothetical protein